MRRALIIGNNNYQDKSGNNISFAENDAKSMEEALKDLGFDTVLGLNLKSTEITEKLLELNRGSNKEDIGLFYFAGHGFQAQGCNILAAEDTSFFDESSKKNTGYPLDKVIEILEEGNYKAKIIIIDACRSLICNERGEGFVGFGEVTAPVGTIIAFATSPGKKAKEHEETGHGYFTEGILKYINIPYLSIEEMFKRVREWVSDSTSKVQIPWEHTSLIGDFYFYEDTNRGEEVYSRYAKADMEYEPVYKGIAYQLIELARSHDFYKQNTIPQIMRENVPQLCAESPDDLFVLGRNLYQCSNDAIKVSRLFDDLHSDLLLFTPPTALHILSGMAYEIYFSKKGQLRKKFKIHKSFSSILSELDGNQQAKDFIVRQLANFPERLVYLLGQNPINLYVIVEKDGNEWMVRSIQFQGKNTMFTITDDSIYNPRNDVDANYGTVEDLEKKLRNRIASTKRGVVIQYNMKEGEIEAGKLIIPEDFYLKR